MAYIIPAVIFFILTAAVVKKQPAYDLFLGGAREGVKIAAGIFPPLLAILTATYMLRASGTIDFITSLLKPVSNFLPPQIVPLALIRPLSGSGAMGILTDILKNSGADTEIGRLSSVIMGSTETTFYCLAVYFAKTRAKHTLRAVPFAVAGDLTGIIAAIILIRFFHF